MSLSVHGVTLPESETLRSVAPRAGEVVARWAFERRGNRQEAHLTELELAHCCALAAESAIRAEARLKP